MILGLLFACADPVTAPAWPGAVPVVADALDADAWLAAWPTPDGQELWLVGGQLARGAVLRGSPEGGFTPVELPADVPLLTAVSGVAPDDVWVAGLEGSVLHWDGVSWRDHTFGFEEAFWSLEVGSELGEVVVVGGPSGLGSAPAYLGAPPGELPAVAPGSATASVKATAYAGGGLARVWDGAGWSEPALPDGTGGLFCSVVADDGALWAFGEAGAAVEATPRGWVAVGSGLADPLHGVRGLGGHLSVVGGSTTGLVADLTDHTFTPRERLPAGLNGAAALDDGALLVVGENGWAARVEADGAYTTLYTEEGVQLVDAVPWGSGVIAVGGRFGASVPAFSGTVLELADPGPAAR